MPNFSFVNKESLDTILKTKVFVHSDGQLRAAHLILGYTPISKSFLAPKCVIKAKDPCLHRISVAAPSFLLLGPKPKGVQATTPIFEGIPKVGASSSHPVIKKEKEEKEGEGEKIVEVSHSKDDFDVFNQTLSLEAPIGDHSSPFPVQTDRDREEAAIPIDMGI